MEDWKAGELEGCIFPIFQPSIYSSHPRSFVLKSELFNATFEDTTNSMTLYRIYIDEVGNHDLTHADDPNQRFLSLTGVGRLR
jgi:hypothetical protein